MAAPSRSRQWLVRDAADDCECPFWGSCTAATETLIKGRFGPPGQKVSACKVYMDPSNLFLVTRTNPSLACLLNLVGAPITASNEARMSSKLIPFSTAGPQLGELPAAWAGNHRPDGPKASHALTIKPDQSDQAPQADFCFPAQRCTETDQGLEVGRR